MQTVLFLPEKDVGGGPGRKQKASGSVVLPHLRGCVGNLFRCIGEDVQRLTRIAKHEFDERIPFQRLATTTNHMNMFRTVGEGTPSR